MRFPRYLQDRFGQTYRLVVDRADDCWILRVIDGQRPAAYLYAWYVPGQVLRIHDFKVTDDLVVPEPLLLQLLRRLLRLRPRTISYRRRGIGTALLATLVAYADAEGIPRLEGDIVERDRSQFPGLPDWYRARGFTVHRDTPGLHFFRIVPAPSTITA
jgi:hypothetical protein